MPHVTSPYTQRSIRTQQSIRSAMRTASSHFVHIRAFIPFIAWICGIAVALSIRYGYYGDQRLVVGPSSSRLIEINPVLVKKIVVKGDPKQGLLLHGFKDMPDLNSETYLTESNQFYLDGYGRKGFFMWLNKGSKLQMYWNVEGSSRRYRDMLVLLIKGEQNADKSQRFYRVSSRLVGLSDNGGKRAEYTVPDDDNYYFGIVNLSPRNMITTLRVNGTSKIYDTSKAISICSTIDGPCRLDISFPSTRYFVLTTADANNVSTAAWNIEVLFVARLITYLLITAFFGVIVYLIMKNIGACDPTPDVTEQQGPTVTERETDPILPTKEIPCTYGTTEDAPESSICCSGEDLYDGKICVICYEGRRDCFFIPCGHSVTCFSCGKRIMEEDNKVCPICRRLIHKLRRLFSA
ncbi:RING/U-box superfamily protein [Rhynchospora pubera]|uniref:RING/U-box superfamily protein n=1 Tax=Rhynchospora pubera TaxID=906938 RepID=A0AAV8D0U0_9POAL|nr:RING/U-box superfamily protein [Rhynchospora pubera]KAJ4812532.1 RING/U-box superfamily protein [Rhynchospora pubera]